MPGDATATANHLRSSQALLRAGIGSELFHQAAGIFLALTSYSLLRTVNQTRAVLMVVLSVVSVPIVFLNVLNEIAALILVSGADFLAAFDRHQLDALAFLALRLHGQGLTWPAYSGGSGSFHSGFWSCDRLSFRAFWAFP